MTGRKLRPSTEAASDRQKILELDKKEIRDLKKKSAKFSDLLKEEEKLYAETALELAEFSSRAGADDSSPESGVAESSGKS